MSYLTVTEVESALTALAAAYPTLTELITLPNLTHEKRTCHALRIGTGSAGTKDAVLFIGGVHAREWGSCDICINFAADVLEAYTLGTGLAYGGKSFPSARIKGIIEGLHVFVFPLVNPDGRFYSQNSEPMWRKNRKPLGHFFGVDINRNYDFLWDFPSFFAPDSHVSMFTSTNSWDDTYHGEVAFSELETKNVLWLLDQYPRIRRFIDIHSYGQKVLFPWGDDENQTTDQTMNFRNSVFNGVRGKEDDAAYKEYISPDDLAAMSRLAIQVRDAIQAVRGKIYIAEQFFYLYPAAGTINDYAYARHLVDPKKNKVYGLAIEWGSEFQPPWEEMENIILEVTAGLIEFCPIVPKPPSGLIVR